MNKMKGHLLKRFVLAVAAMLCSFAIAANAESITKTFEIGPGTANTTSNYRTFSIPGCEGIGVTVHFQRLGEAGSANDVPIVIEVRSPGSNADTDGPIVSSKTDTATRIQKTAGFTPGSSETGCDIPWRVRVRSQNGPAPVAVTGDIVVAYNGGDYDVAVEDAGNINLNSANTVTVKVGGTGGLPQGTIVIRGEWFHNLGVMPIRMKFELINPNGTVVATEYGYSKNEINPCCSANKMRLAYTIRNCIKGQWKLRIKNVSDGHDAIRVRPLAVKNASCN
jgi:hypothetical protein